MLSEIQRFECYPNVLDDDIRDNLSKNIKLGLPFLKVRRAVIVGGGPSMADYLSEIRTLKEQGSVLFALNGAARFLIGKGIVPDYHVIYDARPDNKVFLTGHPGVHHLVSSHAHPGILEALAGHQVTLFHAMANDGVLAEVRKHDKSACVLGPAITVGLQALNIAIVMGFRSARLYGYDSSNRGAGKHAYAQPLNANRKVTILRYGGKDYEADPVMAAQAKDFMLVAPNYERIGLKIDVAGYGLLPDMWRDHKNAPAPAGLKEREAAKYSHVWQHPNYRKWSPGEDLVETFVRACAVERGSRIIDFGCGSGRAAKALAMRGYDVLAVDHTLDCLDAGLRVPFCLACLWDLPKLEPADWGYCTDVMEHIPPEKVDAVLTGIAANVKQGAFFNISFEPDDFGSRLIGSPLHLTVRPSEWWAESLSCHFPGVQLGGDGVFICRN